MSGDKATRLLDTILRANAFGCGVIVMGAAWEGAELSTGGRVLAALVGAGCMAYACVPRKEDSGDGQ